MANPLVLASQLLVESYCAHDSQRIDASTGCSAIDQVLQHGFRYGEISSLSGLEQTGKTLIAMHAAATHVLLHQASEVAVIDTTGSFSPLLLCDILITRDQQLRLASGKPPGSLSAPHIKAYLDRVKIMRAFDLVGVGESIQEVSEEWSPVALEGRASIRDPPSRSAEIKSSQDEDEDVEAVSASINDKTGEVVEEAVSAIKARMIVVDQISNITSRELAQNHIGGQASFAIFLRELRKVTTQCNACTILINQAVKAGNSLAQAGEHDSRVAADQSRGFVPGLGRTYWHGVDLSILILPTYYPGPLSRQRQTLLHFEVLWDRFGGRAGLQGAFRLEGRTLGSET